MCFPIKPASVAVELPMQDGIYGGRIVRTTFVGAETQDIDAYFFVLIGTKKCFVCGGYVEGST